MNAYQAYKLYLSVKFHFSQEKYDYFKYRGNVKTKVENFKQRKDKHFFERASEKYPTKELLCGYFVANMIENPDYYIAEFRDEKTHKAYKEWHGRMQSLEYYFSQDLSYIQEQAMRSETSFKDMFKVDKTGKSPISDMAISHEISPESYVALDKILGLYTYYQGKIRHDPVYEKFAFLMRKYGSFVNIDMKEFKTKFLEFANIN